MAIGIGSIVSPQVSGGLFSGVEPVQPQPTRFGVVTAQAAGVVSVLWDDGRFETGILEVETDEILDADPTEVTRLEGRVVRVTTASTGMSESPEFDAMPLSFYRRAGAATTRVLVLLRARQMWRELASTTLQPVAGR